jgi:replication factor C large subunit
MNKLPLIEKYRVKKFSDIKGQDFAVEEVNLFYKRFPIKKAIILNGAVGTGKTSLAIALANEYNLELFELNASDLRNRQKLEEILKPATIQQSLFKKSKIILLDEADGITATDRGGLPELLVLIDKTSFPIIITANDIWQQKYSLLRKKCQLVTLREINESIVLELLKNVIKKEKKDIQLNTLKLIAKKARGDIRAALNDLQIVIESGEQEFISEQLEREKEETIFSALKKLFQEPTTNKTINIYDNTNLELDEIILWIEENLPAEYQGQALAKAYDYLSKADIFKGRVYRQQYWRFLVYQNFFLSAGISSATKLKYNKFTQYKRPSRILKIWLSNQKNEKKKSIVTKFAKFTHMSKRKAMKESFLMPLIINKKSEKDLDLDEKEHDFLEDKKATLIITNNLNKFKEN